MDSMSSFSQLQIPNSIRDDRARVGYDAEMFVASLFSMQKQPENSLLPDLIDYSNNLQFEVKSGRQGKGVLVADQIASHYFNPTNYRNYCCLVERDHSIKLNDLETPFSCLKLNWNNLYIIPMEFAYNLFIAEFARRTASNTISGRVMFSNKDNLIRNLYTYCESNGLSLHEIRKKLPQSQGWQNFDGRLIKSLVTSDESILTTIDKERNKILRRNYSNFQNLKRLYFDGPNNVGIYCLVNPIDLNFLEDLFGSRLEAKKKTLEEVSQMRAGSIDIISNLPILRLPSGKIYKKAANGLIPDSLMDNISLSRTQVYEYSSLCRWELPN